MYISHSQSTQRFSTELDVQPITLHTVPSVHKVNMLAAGTSGVGTGGSGGSMNRGPRAPGAPSSGATENFFQARLLGKSLKLLPPDDGL